MSPIPQCSAMRPPAMRKISQDVNTRCLPVGGRRNRRPPDGLRRAKLAATRSSSARLVWIVTLRSGSPFSRAAKKATVACFAVRPAGGGGAAALCLMVDVIVGEEVREGVDIVGVQRIGEFLRHRGVGGVRSLGERRRRGDGRAGEKGSASHDPCLRYDGPLRNAPARADFLKAEAAASAFRHPPPAHEGGGCDQRPKGVRRP